jgi:methyl-accepting chemotaxis protein
VESSGDALRQIVGEVTAISGLVDGIAEAAQRQSQGIEEISSMVNSMDEFTQQNAAMVEESSASTHNLSDETGRLMEQLGRFRLQRSGSSTPSYAASGSSGVDVSLPAFSAAAGKRPAPMPQVSGTNALKMEDDWAEF